MGVCGIWQGIWQQQMGIGEDKVLWRIAFEYDIPYIDDFRQSIKNIRKGFIPCLHPFKFFIFPLTLT